MTTQFKNGNAHGKSVEYYDNGQLADESYFDNGDYIGYKTWYPNGNIKSERAVGKNDSFKYRHTSIIILKICFKIGFVILYNWLYHYRIFQG